MVIYFGFIWYSTNWWYHVEPKKDNDSAAEQHIYQLTKNTSTKTYKQKFTQKQTGTVAIIET